jgi:hypothetical protein
MRKPATTRARPVLPIEALRSTQNDQSRPPIPSQQVQKRRPQPVVSMGMGIKLNP